MKKRIAIVNQRYGKEVVGGSEYYTRLIAERLNQRYDVEVLTTRAMDHQTWENVYPEGEQMVDQIRVRRFTVEKTRDMRSFIKVNAQTIGNKKRTREDEEKWLEAQGPYCPQFLTYLKTHKDEYDIIIFVTYLYYLTAKGMQEVAEKSILIPTAHDEPLIYFSIYDEVFCSPRAIVFLTHEERAFVHRLFCNERIPNDVMGVGIDRPERVDAAHFREKFHIDGDYLIYVGRIETGKKCDWMLKYFRQYKKRHRGKLKLVLMGKALIDIPKDPDIICLGFVSEQDKFDGVAGAKALILPSAFESLSISVLEAMSIGTPVIVNGVCEVLKGHCIKSNAGLYYRDYFEFEGCVNYMLAHPEQVAQMQENAKQYVHDHYRWDVIMQQFDRIIETVTD